MNVHKNARLTPQGRALLVQRVRTDGWRVGDAAAAAGISLRQAFRWLARHRAGEQAREGGSELALQDRSSAPVRCRRTDADTVAAIERLRRERRTGPQIARELAVPRSTVGVVLRRLGLGRLSALETKPKIVRYEREKPGELIHIDIKKLGRIDGVGHRITGDRTGQSNKRGTGWEYLHVAIDDACRLAYSEVLVNEKAESAVAFTRRAVAWFKRFGVSVERIMTDNGSAYKSFAFRDLLAEQAIRHKRTRPYTPRTNGKAERFIQTSLREWAYAQPYTSSAERTETLKPWLQSYNTSRTHSGIKHMTPFAKLNNVLGFDIYATDGARLYLTAGERTAFLKAAERADGEDRTLCMTLAYSGCRLSEALALTVDRVDLAGGLLVFESLKKRRPGVYRAVPVPPALLEALDLVHGIRERQGSAVRARAFAFGRVAA